MKEKETCIQCLQELKPDLESKNYATGEWDGHTYFPCECMGEVPKEMRLVVG